MIPSAKARFLADTVLSKWHADLVVKREFMQAMDAAIGAYAAKLSRHQPHVEAGLLLRGAQDFIATFTELSEQPTVQARKDLDNLT